MVKVLVVDDIEDNIKLIGADLEDEGYDVVSALSGAEGISRAAEELPDVILLDVMMPGLDGITVCQRLKADPGLSHIPIIMVSADGSIERVLTALDAGALDYIGKPFNSQIMLARVRSAVRLRQMQDEILDRNRRLKAEVSVRRRAEQSLREANDELEQRVAERTSELTEANDEIRNFAYIVSHDLRAPLLNIKGFASELSDACAVVEEVMRRNIALIQQCDSASVADAINEDIPEALSFINASASRMDELISCVLKLSRLGHSELVVSVVDLTKLANRIVDSLAHQILDRGAIVEVESLPTLSADAVGVELVMGNLIDNAIKYLDPERPGRIRIYSKTVNGCLRVVVEDNGTGISDEDQKHIFDLFRRAGRFEAEGDGMGLAYARTMMRRHGGSVECESELGTGSTFTLVFESCENKPVEVLV